MADLPLFAADGTTSQVIVNQENRSALRLHDNRDDRREMMVLLERIGPERRKQFLAWACSQCRGVLRPKVSVGTEGAALEVFFDLWHLSTQWGLDLDRALRRLERCVRVWTA